MQPSQALVVVSPIYADVTLNILAEFFANLGKNSFITNFAHYCIGEVRMHAGAVPIQVLAQWLGFPVNGQAVSLSSSL